MLIKILILLQDSNMKKKINNQNTQHITLISIFSFFKNSLVHYIYLQFATHRVSNVMEQKRCCPPFVWCLIFLHSKRHHKKAKSKKSTLITASTKDK